MNCIKQYTLYIYGQGHELHYLSIVTSRIFLSLLDDWMDMEAAMMALSC